ncbi:MAG: F0F1 ATP synthase subunit epsilon [Clostridium argentinense]|uniref:ATP synthase epsilon chain n=1 Tax=Clostridium faecium TaxID=2762223 RepID=A0ABR8YTR5_9CLOT|nr:MULTISPECIES: F0F1 ATP synthase subunit epsilon [Clostridium]MBD8047615.1 F0F1 ATP synthase subunit epsilon [Clostridium faecium]MBS5823252.1 F0F1 ATP synthase subunit epsilon [Clostridium argentinense]MDU1349654.1 F0F1 ATP synthase subunit epsilon [Clostridium argentinense]
MEKSFKLIIMTPDKEFYKGEVVNLNSESSEGRFGILPNHIAMASDLIPTITNFRDINDKEFHGFTSNGVIKIKDNVVTILCNAAEWPEDIDRERAKSAQERAEERLKSKDNIDIQRAELALRRSLMRLNLSK